jgi:ABC-type nitrate/sulfonate/bicarbonate transport system permease component
MSLAEAVLSAAIIVLLFVTGALWVADTVMPEPETTLEVVSPYPPEGRIVTKDWVSLKYMTAPVDMLHKEESND